MTSLLSLRASKHSASEYRNLRAKIATQDALVGVVGLGYVGLPLSRAFVSAGFHVLGFDIDASKVTQLQEGKSYISSLSDQTLRAMNEYGFSATDWLERLDEPDVILICVPTPLTDSREPDLTYVRSAARHVAAKLRPGQIVVLESTSYPGTTRQVVLPILKTSGLRVGHEFFLAYSPEREDPGNPQYGTERIPKVVAGLEPRSLDLAVALYGRAITRVVRTSRLEVAEACKLLENTYRAVNIALVNELKVLYDRMDIDIWEVIDAARTKPFGFQAFYPGPGLGGHCIPVDPFYLAWLGRKHGVTTRFIELAGEINTAMPTYVVGKIADALNEQGKPVQGSKILLLGIAYKKDVDDLRESPGLKLVELLQKKGANVSYNDPHVPQLPSELYFGIESVRLTEGFLGSQDCVVVVTDHSEYDWTRIVAHSRIVVDTRNATRGITAHRERIVKA